VRAQKIIWSFSLFLGFIICGHAQTTTTRPPAGQRIGGTTVTGEDDEIHERQLHDMAKKANEERQKALKSDTDKLVKLAGELKEDVDKSNENVLSLDVLKKAEEIEKLARSVKEKMKGAN
jgi:hypothetical protein